MADKVISHQLNKPGVPERWADMGDGTFARVVGTREVSEMATSTPNPRFDAFGRSRVATPETLFDAKQIVDNLPLFF